MYVGSSSNITCRLNFYFNLNYLIRASNMYINRILLKEGYSSFSLYILEYCNQEKGVDFKTDLLKREQYYINLLKPEYNILQIAGSSLGYRHTKKTLAKSKEKKFFAGNSS